MEDRPWTSNWMHDVTKVFAVLQIVLKLWKDITSQHIFFPISNKFLINVRIQGFLKVLCSVMSNKIMFHLNWEVCYCCSLALRDKHLVIFRLLANNRGDFLGLKKLQHLLTYQHVAYVLLQASLLILYMVISLLLILSFSHLGYSIHTYTHILIFFSWCVVV